PIKIAPAATPVAARPATRPMTSGDEVRSEDGSRSQTPIANSQVMRPLPTAVHPRDIPATPQPASPSIASSALEREHLQAQQQLRLQQEAARQKMQQQ